MTIYACFQIYLCGLHGRMFSGICYTKKLPCELASVLCPTWVIGKHMQTFEDGAM